jgi:hypothetical protein
MSCAVSGANGTQYQCHISHAKELSRDLYKRRLLDLQDRKCEICRRSFYYNESAQKGTIASVNGAAVLTDDRIWACNFTDNM